MELSRSILTHALDTLMFCLRHHCKQKTPSRWVDIKHNTYTRTHVYTEV